MTPAQRDLRAAVRAVRTRQRRRASQAAAAANRQGQLALLAAVAASSDDPAAILGITDADAGMGEVWSELSHRWEDPR